MSKLKLSAQEGRALALTLIVLAVGCLLIPPLLAHTSTNLAATRATEEGLKEQYAADAGVEYAIREIIDGDFIENTPFPLPTLVNGMPVTVTVTTIEGEVTYKVITSTASSLVDGSSTTIESYVAINPNIFESLFGAAITVNDDLYIEDATVDGDIWVSGTFSQTGSVITGTVLQNQPFEFPALDPEPYRAEALAGTIVEGDLLIEEDTTYTNTIYIEGDLKIQAGVTVTLTGTVWVVGTVIEGEEEECVEVEDDPSIFIEGTSDTDTSITGTGNLIAERGNIRIEYLNLDTTNMPLVWAVQCNIEKIETNQYIKAIFYAPEGDIKVEETDVIYGVLFGKTVSLFENCGITYPDQEDFGDLFSGGTLEMRTYNIKP